MNCYHNKDSCCRNKWNGHHNDSDLLRLYQPNVLVRQQIDFLRAQRLKIQRTTINLVRVNIFSSRHESFDNSTNVAFNMEARFRTQQAPLDTENNASNNHTQNRNNQSLVELVIPNSLSFCNHSSFPSRKNSTEFQRRLVCRNLFPILSRLANSELFQFQTHSSFKRRNSRKMYKMDAFFWLLKWCYCTTAQTQITSWKIHL